jgi:hypothetical protein
MTLIENIPRAYKLPMARFVVKWGTSQSYKCITTVTFAEAMAHLQHIVWETCNEATFYKLERCDDTFY